MSAISFTTPAACECCSPLTGRTRGGTATINGYNAWDESNLSAVPPFRYNQLSAHGAICQISYSHAIGDPDGCYGGLVASSGRQITGTNIVWPPSGFLNLYNISASGAVCDPDATGGTFVAGRTNWNPLASDLYAEGILPYNYPPCVKTITADEVTLDGTESCGVRVLNSEWTGSMKFTLSDTATLDNDYAIMKLLLPTTPGEVWSAWVGGARAALARWEHRVTGFSFIYREAQWKVVRGGLTPSTTYSVAITMQRSVFGADSFSLYSTVTVSATTDGSGVLTATGDVPSDEGYETYADTVTIT